MDPTQARYTATVGVSETQLTFYSASDHAAMAYLADLGAALSKGDFVLVADTQRLVAL